MPVGTPHWMCEGGLCMYVGNGIVRGVSEKSTNERFEVVVKGSLALKPVSPATMTAVKEK